ncbi:site-2 protease family protein [Candidatus Microgenomates bacterium]|nr:site-2 protease family protein [Candidatus Microgenomates bacterium]
MFITFIIFIIIISTLILVHEFGHFIIAKRVGIKVLEFALGFPPKILKFRRGDTLYSIGAIPFGGFVRMYGEDQKVTQDVSRSFSNKPKKTRALIIAAGVLMNLLLGVMLFSIVYSATGIPRAVDTGKVTVVEVGQNTPAYDAGMMSGDIIVSIDGEKISKIDDFKSQVEAKKGKETKLEIQQKDGKSRTVVATPRVNPPKNEGPLGVVIVDKEITFYFAPFWQRPILGAWYGIKEAMLWGEQTILGTAALFGGIATNGKVPEGAAGPVGIYSITKTVCSDVWSCLRFMGIISINLAILNILPIPPFDGGKLFFVGVEAVFLSRAARVRAKIEQFATIAGLAFILWLLISITMQDISRLLGR